MFTLLRAWDAEHELSPEDFQYILTPREAFRNARLFYDISSDHYQRQHFSCHDIPRRKTGNVSLFAVPDQRRYAGYADDVYDYTERNLDDGWTIGIDTGEHWDCYRNPFFFDQKSHLVYDCFMDTYCGSFEMEVRKAYEKCLNHHNGRPPVPTVKQRYGDAPAQHAQAGKTLNSKGAGRLLAAGGIYNGNLEGFRSTAEQLGGEATAGYDQVLNTTTQGTAIALASVAAGLGIGRFHVASDVGQLKTLSQTPRVLDVEKIGGFSLEQLSQSGRRRDLAAKSGNFTVAGRALQKHGSREGSAFPIATGTPAQINDQGQNILESTIQASIKTIKEGNRFGGFDVISSNGKGARFDSDGNFRGFLEP